MGTRRISDLGRAALLNIPCFHAVHKKHVLALGDLRGRVRGKGLSRRDATYSVLCSLAVYDSLGPMINAPREIQLGTLIESRPETVGAAIWPYQCLGWDVRTRRAHYSVVKSIGGGTIDFPVDGRLLLLDIREVRDGLQVILDQPKWYLREGQLVINLFLGDIRMYSLAFTLSA